MRVSMILFNLSQVYLMNPLGLSVLKYDAPTPDMKKKIGIPNYTKNLKKLSFFSKKF